MRKSVKQVESDMKKCSNSKHTMCVLILLSFIAEIADRARKITFCDFPTAWKLSPIRARPHFTWNVWNILEYKDYLIF